MNGKKEVADSDLSLRDLFVDFVLHHNLELTCWRIMPHYASIILNVAGWWRWKRVWRDEKAARWRKVVGLVGLVANTSALCLVCVSLFYSVAVEKADRRFSKY